MTSDGEFILGNIDHQPDACLDMIRTMLDGVQPTCIIGFKCRRIRSSSLQSLERGRPTEIDDRNGYIRERAAAHAIPVRLNQAVAAMIKEIEAGKRRTSMANMDDPAFVDF